MTPYNLRRAILFCASAIFLVMGLFPPWIRTIHAPKIINEKPAGYAFITSPPAPEYSGPEFGVRLDYSRLLLEWVLLSVFTLAGSAITGGIRESDSKTNTSRSEAPPSFEKPVDIPLVPNQKGSDQAAIHWVRNSYITWLRNRDPERLLDLLISIKLEAHLDEIDERAVQYQKMYFERGFQSHEIDELIQESLMPSDALTRELEWDQEDELDRKLEPLLAAFRKWDERRGRGLGVRKPREGPADPR